MSALSQALDKLTIPLLQTRCGALGLATSGIKADIVQRLTADPTWLWDETKHQLIAWSTLPQSRSKAEMIRVLAGRDIPKPNPKPKANAAGTGAAGAGAEAKPKPKKPAAAAAAATAAAASATAAGSWAAATGAGTGRTGAGNKKEGSGAALDEKHTGATPRPAKKQKRKRNDSKRDGSSGNGNGGGSGENSGSGSGSGSGHNEHGGEYAGSSAHSANSAMLNKQLDTVSRLKAELHELRTQIVSKENAIREAEMKADALKADLQASSTAVDRLLAQQMQMQAPPQFNIFLTTTAHAISQASAAAAAAGAAAAPAAAPAAVPAPKPSPNSKRSSIVHVVD